MKRGFLNCSDFLSATLVVAGAFIISSCSSKDIPKPVDAVVTSGITLENPAITTESMSVSGATGTVGFSWQPATEDGVDPGDFDYQICISAPDPAVGTFSTVSQVLAGGCIDAGSSTTLTGSTTAGHAYYFNVVAISPKGDSIAYLPKGEFVDAHQLNYYPFENSLMDVIGANDLEVLQWADGGGPFVPGTMAADRFGSYNSAYRFSFGNNSQCLQSTYALDSTLVGEHARTLSFWANADYAGGTGVNSPISVGSVEGDGGHFGIKFDSNGGPWKSWFWGITEDSETSVNYSANKGWMHWVLTYSGGASNGDFIAYLNGVQVDFFNSFTTVPNTDITSPLIVGCGLDNTTAPMIADHYFNGLIDDVRLFDRVLTSSEVQHLYHVGQ